MEKNATYIVCAFFSILIQLHHKSLCIWLEVAPITFVRTKPTDERTKERERGRECVCVFLHLLSCHSFCHHTWHYIIILHVCTSTTFPYHFSQSTPKCICSVSHPWTLDCKWCVPSTQTHRALSYTHTKNHGRTSRERGSEKKPVVWSTHTRKALSIWCYYQ